MKSSALGNDRRWRDHLLKQPYLSNYPDGKDDSCRGEVHVHSRWPAEITNFLAGKAKKAQSAKASGGARVYGEAARSWTYDHPDGTGSGRDDSEDSQG